MFCFFFFFFSLLFFFLIRLSPSTKLTKDIIYLSLGIRGIASKILWKHCKAILSVCANFYKYLTGNKKVCEKKPVKSFNRLLLTIVFWTSCVARGK
uniref:Putative secreted protein n=1 Tax=Rhipicephalus microplus TaxID=6941 RepID=A0A6M2D9F6_RHIMP